MEKGPRGNVRRVRSCEQLFFPAGSFSDVLIALTGTPGVGKSTVASMLSKRGYEVMELSRIIKDKDLLGDFDEARETYEVDVEKLDMEILELPQDRPLILVGHLSHLLSVHLVIILRCSPSVLRKRLSGRGWSESKVQENLEAEACDVILIEALDSGLDVCEIDTTKLSPDSVVDGVEDIIQGEREKYAPGNIDWSEEVLDWF
ncbi:MAG TPA: adenylate kinase family protein [Methanomassiliicoccales archaeon]|nr:adenylate kinase family protein [Methanomassiliicoccales archaeon]